MQRLQGRARLTFSCTGCIIGCAFILVICMLAELSALAPVGTEAGPLHNAHCAAAQVLSVWTCCLNGYGWRCCQTMAGMQRRPQQASPPWRRQSEHK